MAAQLGMGRMPQAQVLPWAPATLTPQDLCLPHLRGQTEKGVVGALGWSGFILARRRLPLTTELAAGSVCPLSYCLQREQHLSVIFIFAILLLGDPGRFLAWGTELGGLFASDSKEHNTLSKQCWPNTPAQKPHLVWDTGMPSGRAAHTGSKNL